MVEAAGFSVEAVEDPGTQYFVVSARKGLGPDRSTYYLPGEPEDGGWRPAEAQSAMRLLAPGGAARLYAGIYFWSADDSHAEHSVSMTVDGKALGARVARGPGDHFLEWAMPARAGGMVEVEMNIAPACAAVHRPALRIVGIAAAL
jgi:hypothetical protein